MPKELNVAEAARRLGISLDALYRLVYASKLPARKQDGRWLIPALAVERRLRAKEQRGRQEHESASAR